MNSAMQSDYLSQTYPEFLTSKEMVIKPCGFKVELSAINSMLFPFQRDVTLWSLYKGKSALFLKGGLGKAPITLEWAKHVAAHTGSKVLIVAPLGVSHQLGREAIKFGVDAQVCKDQSEITKQIVITNYERLHRFNLSTFDGLACDEASVFKSEENETFKTILTSFRDTPFKLLATATPSPNYHDELGNYAWILGIMTKTEMRAEYFEHDGGDTSKWILKYNAEERFWKFIAQWAVAMRYPSDLNYDDDGFLLPKKTRHQIVINATKATPGYLIPVEARQWSERQAVRRDSIPERVAAVKELIYGRQE
jgi:hypothetical protein